MSGSFKTVLGIGFFALCLFVPAQPGSDRGDAKPALGHRGMVSSAHGLTIHYTPEGVIEKFLGAADPRDHGLAREL